MVMAIIHIVNPDPFEDFSDELKLALERSILCEDWEMALSRIEVIEEIIEGEWSEITTSNAADRWADHYRSKGVVAAEENGEWRLSPGRPGDNYHDGEVNLNSSLVDQLIEEALLPKPDETECIRVSQSVGDVLREWRMLLLDQEKLAGHLLRVHKCKSKELDGDEASLLVIHRRLHSRI